MYLLHRAAKITRYLNIFMPIQNLLVDFSNFLEILLISSKISKKVLLIYGFFLLWGVNVCLHWLDTKLLAITKGFCLFIEPESSASIQHSIVLISLRSCCTSTFSTPEKKVLLYPQYILLLLSLLFSLNDFEKGNKIQQLLQLHFFYPPRKSTFP